MDTDLIFLTDTDIRIPISISVISIGLSLKTYHHDENLSDQNYLINNEMKSTDQPN